MITDVEQKRGLPQTGHISCELFNLIARTSFLQISSDHTIQNVETSPTSETFENGFKG